MRLKNTPFASLICVSLLGTAALSQAETLWQLDFDALSGDIGSGSVAVSQPGFPGNFFDGIATVNSGVVVSGNTKAELNQTFSAAVGATGTIWLSFDWGHNSDNANNYADTYGGLSFFESNYPTLTEKGLLGNNWNSPNWTGTTISNIGVKTAVAKITLSDTGEDAVELWLGETSSAVDVSGPAMATLSMELSNVNCLRFNGGNNQQFDNLIIATTMAEVGAINGPPPTATSGTWTNTAGGTWDTAANWLDSIVATGSSSTANFNTLNLTTDTTVNLDSAQIIGNLVFGDTDTSSAAGWTLAGNPLTLVGTTPTLTVNDLGETKTVTISAAIAGMTGLTKDGSGTLTLSAANSYSGATTVSNGTLQVSGQRYFNVGRMTTVAAGAVLELSNSNNTFTTLMPTSTITGAGTFRLSGNSTINQELNGVNGTRLTFAMQAGGLIDLLDTSRLTNGGWQLMNWTDNKASMNIASGATLDVWDGQDVIIDALTGSGTVDKLHGGNSPRLLKVGANNGSGTFSGTIQNTGGQLALVKTGTGNQTLSGVNTYSGNTTVEDGTLSIAPGGSLRFYPTTPGQTNSLSGTETATLSYLGTLDLDLTAADLTDGNYWTLIDVGSFSGPLPTLTPEAVTSSLGSFTETSPGTWELSTLTAKWTFTEDNGSLTCEVTATPYELWANSFDPAIGLPSEDDDNDGVTNFEEYAFGLPPNSGTSVNPIAAPLDKATGTFSYTRRATSSLNYSVWFSENLVDWTEDTDATEGSPVSSGDNETVPVTLSALPGNPLPAKLFIQVRAN